MGMKSRAKLQKAQPSIARCFYGSWLLQVLANEDEELDRCNGTPAFLAPEMMKPHARFRWGRSPPAVRSSLRHLHTAPPAPAPAPFLGS